MTIRKSKIKFEDYYYDNRVCNGMITLYFRVPKSWLPKKYKDAKHATVSIECPILLMEPHMCTVMISPTRPCQSCLLRRILKDDGYEDYDWTDWNISDAENK